MTYLRWGRAAAVLCSFLFALSLVACGGGSRGTGDGGGDADPGSDASPDDAGEDAGPGEDGGPSGSETCGNGTDDDADGEVDEGCPCDPKDTTPVDCYGGPPDTRRVGACADGQMVCTEGFEFGEWGECMEDVLPGEESCETTGVDEDCDGSVDEGCECTGDEPEPCGSDVGACSAGVQECIDGVRGACEESSGPTDETCNGIDDDCDGTVDEGLVRGCGVSTGACTEGTEACVDGEWGECTGGTDPTTESCNSEDDDCDGMVDEDLTRDCGSTVGICTAGSQSCSAGTWSECSGGTLPTVEECNDMDDDCDGSVDEGLTRDCGSTTGICEPGTETCSAGSWGSCEGGTSAGTEACDGSLDEDCDGTVDEGCGCTSGETRSCGTDEGECVAGTQTCDDSGMWGTCEGDVGPTTEECNDLDDDCDGGVDEGGICPTSPPSVTCPADESAEVLSTIGLSGSGSDPDGGTVSYSWTVTSRPTGSTSEPDPADSASTSLYLDASGTYELEFCVTDDEGETACCNVTVESTPPGAIHWELSWDTEYGDADIHVLNQTRTPPDGWWDDSTNGDDCHFRNMTPDWGPGGADGDPSLDIDDTDGYGPENVTIDTNPVSGTYHAAVHYFCQHSIGSGSAEGDGPTTATLRVFCDGSLIAEYTGLDLSQTDDWLTVASVDYPSCSGMSVMDRAWGHELAGEALHCSIPCSGDADCPGEEVCRSVVGPGGRRDQCVVP